jgi:hypothetical protein
MKSDAIREPHCFYIHPRNDIKKRDFDPVVMIREEVSVTELPSGNATRGNGKQIGEK